MENRKRTNKNDYFGMVINTNSNTQFTFDKTEKYK
jgi:hypothetical protein